MLVVADLHLTDALADEYRWAVFKEMQDIILADGINRLVIAGDITDRKDRHSAALVNRLVREIKTLATLLNGPIYILMGNHDQPLRGEPFWAFLEELENVFFYSEPGTDEAGDLLFLPFTPNPKEAWAEIDIGHYKCVFMHQPVNGAVGETGIKLVVDNMPFLPRSLVVYSGDIHTPQKVGAVQYIGAPHPVKFGDTHTCRLLELDDRTYKIKNVITLHPMRKHSWTISSTADLTGVCTAMSQPGDQARIRFELPLNQMDQWPIYQQMVRDWGKAVGVSIISLEALIVAPLHGASASPKGVAAPDRYSAPSAILAAFAEAEKLDPGLLELGQLILQESISAALSK